MKVNQVVAHAMKREGLKVLTGFPYNQVIDSCAEIGIRPIIARSERVAINIADGYSRMSADEAFGACAVQYGPGAEASVGALAQAFSDSVPLLLVPSGYDSHWNGVAPNFRAEEGFRCVSKAVMSVNYPDRAALMVQRAYGLLRTGKRGPVVLEIPDDLMASETEFNPANYASVRVAHPVAASSEIDWLLRRIYDAKCPIFMVGRGVLQAGAWVALRDLAERLQMPVMTTLAGKSAFPEDHALSLGTGGLSRPRMVDEFLAKADLIVGFGTTFTRSHYIAAIPGRPAIIQVTDDAADVSNSYFIDSVIIGNVKSVLGQMVEASRNTASRGKSASLAEEIAGIKRAFIRDWSERLDSSAEPMSPYRVVIELMKAVDRKTTVVTHDSGNPRDQIVPFYEVLSPLGYIGWGKSTPLGAGLGLAMGAKLAKPDWLSVNVMGDAAIGMVGMDIETAVRADLPIMTVVLNNGLMAGYTYWQPIATAKYNIQYLGGRYADLAKALGAHGERVERLGDLPAAFQRAVRQTKDGKPALVEVMTREEAVLAVPQSHH